MTRYDAFIVQNTFGVFRSVSSASQHLRGMHL